jgi:hypothetical protein
MKHRRLAFSYLILFISFFCCSQSFFAKTTLHVYDNKIESDKKDTIELEYYAIKNKDLKAIIDSVINERKRSPFHFFEYKFRICTSLVTKDGEITVQKDEIKNINKKKLYWLVEIELHEGENFAEKRLDWGVLKYKDQLFALACHPCHELFYSMRKKEVFSHRTGLGFYGFSMVMSWTYKYYDNHFIFVEKKKYK